MSEPTKSVERDDLYKAISLLTEYQALCDCSAVAGMSWHAQVDALREKYADAILAEEGEGDESE